jgi:hypothetical protein
MLVSGPAALRDPVCLLVVAACPQPPLEPHDGDRVVPAQAVEQVDQLACIPEEQVAIFGGVLLERALERA